MFLSTYRGTAMITAADILNEVLSSGKILNSAIGAKRLSAPLCATNCVILVLLLLWLPVNN